MKEIEWVWKKLNDAIYCWYGVYTTSSLQISHNHIGLILSLSVPVFVSTYPKKKKKIHSFIISTFSLPSIPSQINFMSWCWCIDQLHWLCLFGVSWALPPLQCRMWLWPTTFGMERGGGLAWKVLGQSGMLFCCVLCVAYGESGMLGVWFSWYLLLKTLLLSGPHWLFLFSA